MPDSGEVQFTPEGGFRFSGEGANPLVPPPAVRFYNNMQLSKLSQTWGYSHTPENRTSFLKDNTSYRGFTVLDRGSLLRIAAAQEAAREELHGLRRDLQELRGLFQQSVTALLGALLPAIHLGEQQRQQRKEKAWGHFDKLIAEIEKTQGPCPAEVRDDLWHRFADDPCLNRYIRGFQQMSVTGVSEVAESYLEENAYLKLPAKNSKAGKKYRAWAEKKPEASPKKEEPDAAS